VNKWFVFLGVIEQAHFIWGVFGGGRGFSIGVSIGIGSGFSIGHTTFSTGSGFSIGYIGDVS